MDEVWLKLRMLRAAMVKVLLFTLLYLAVQSQGAANTTEPTEKAALLTFRNAIVDNDNFLKNWISTIDPCNTWYGVYCDPADQPPTSPDYLHVTELRLLQSNLGGKLVPELGNLTFLITLDVMWNNLVGQIPSTLGNLLLIKILALNGNQLEGPIPPALGNLVNMNRIQLDENNLSGPIPPTFANLVSLAHMHMNNNSLSGPIPSGLGQLPHLIHILLDNNNFSGELPEDIANATTLVILQLDNNHFTGGIPPGYASNLTLLTKLSCRNCSLTGTIPDFSNLSHLNFLDLSFNGFTGSIPSIDMTNMTTIDLSNNHLENDIQSFLVGHSLLQKLTLGNNNLSGTIPDFGALLDYSKNTQLLDFQNNSFNYISLGLLADAAHYPSLYLRLSGNTDICAGSPYIAELAALCTPVFGEEFQSEGNINYLPRGGPIVVTYRLKSPGFSFFTSNYELEFRQYIAYGLDIDYTQISVQSYEWQPGPRLLMIISIDPPANTKFNETEVERIEKAFANWNVKNSTLFGPYELLNVEYLGKGKSALSNGAIVGIILGVLFLLLLVALILLLVLRRRGASSSTSKRTAHLLSLKAAQQGLLKITGVSAFTYKELAQATDDFSEANEVGRGGYGKVYRGVLGSGQTVAIKRANLEAILRNTEFYNEIELLSRCHHRNLLVLVGYCNDEEEQMLVYEFMEGGTLHDNISASTSTTLDYASRLRIALGAAKGILYLHTEANPPIFHRDIKSNNILLNEKKQPKVADFGLSRLAPDVDEASGETSHVSTVVKGTPGYLDPEYFLTRKLTDKSDVYSFGVVLLELMTGMQPIAFGKNIVREVQGFYENGTVLDAVDKRMGSYPSDSIMEFARLALSCVNSETDSRPTMQEVTRRLEQLVNGLRQMGSLGVSKGDISMPITDHSFFYDDKPSPVDDGFDTGSSHQPVSTSNFMSVKGNDYLAPR